MSRVKGGVISAKRRRNVLKRVKGYRGNCSKKERLAHEAILHSARHSFAHRKDKKVDFRQLWIVRLNAALRENGQKSYSTFIGALKKQGITLDRKVLATMAKDHPETFARIVTKVTA